MSWFHIAERAPEFIDLVRGVEYVGVCERECLVLRRGANERSGSEDAGLRACLSKDVVEEGRAPIGREGTCKRTRITRCKRKSGNGMGENKERGLGRADAKLENKHCEGH